jgi:hypothetical protein
MGANTYPFSIYSISKHTQLAKECSTWLAIILGTTARSGGILLLIIRIYARKGVRDCENVPGMDAIKCNSFCYCHSNCDNNDRN